MIATITEDEIRMTATDRLAKSIAFETGLTLADCENIVDAGLADEADFEPDEDDPNAYQYQGDRWTVELSSGRPRLVEAVDAAPHPVGPHTAGVERVFAHVVDFLDGMGSPATQEQIDRDREEIWGGKFRKAAERDAAQDADEKEVTNDGQD